jgi:hypothetical protein
MTFTIWELKEHKDILTSLCLGGQMVIPHETGFAESMGVGDLFVENTQKEKMGWVADLLLMQ